MDKEQIKSILKRVLQRLGAEVTSPWGVQWTKLASEALAEEAEWTAKVSAGFDPDRTCNNCNGPIENEQEHKCIKCNTKYELEFHKEQTRKMARKIVEGGDLILGVAGRDYTGDLDGVVSWYNALRIRAQGFLAQVTPILEEDADPESNLRSVSRSEIGRLADMLGVYDEDGMQDPDNEEFESEDAQRVDEMVSDVERWIGESIAPFSSETAIVNEIVDDIRRGVDEEFLNPPEPAVNIPMDYAIWDTPDDEATMGSSLEHLRMSFSSGWRYLAQSVTIEQHRDPIRMLGNIAPAFHVPNRETTVLVIEGNLYATGTSTLAKIKLDLTFSRGDVSIAGRYIIDNFESDYHSQILMNSNIPPEMTEIRKAIATALMEIIQRLEGQGYGRRYSSR